MIYVLGRMDLFDVPFYIRFALLIFFFALCAFVSQFNRGRLQYSERAKKGQCIYCGYDLQHLVEQGDKIKCPECGESNEFAPARRVS